SSSMRRGAPDAAEPRRVRGAGVPPAYTEDVRVAGALLADKLLTLYEGVMGDEKVFDDPRTIDVVDKVQLVDGRGADANIVGTIHLTTSHLIFKGESEQKEIWVANNLIQSVERGPLSVAGCPLTIKCKHFQVLNLLIRRDKECGDLFESIRRCSQPLNIEELLAFDHRDGGEDQKGWSRLEWTIEFTRQGVDDSWVESDFNKDYAVSDTYPERLWVPAAASKQILLGSAAFRSKGRLPALTYHHRQSKASLCRCAQPLSGFSARCVEDERLMELIAKTNEGGDELLLVDTRPMVNAMVNKVQGKGFEDERNYSGMRFQFFDIENIHVMRSSQAKLIEAQSRARSTSDYLRGLEASGWLKHLRAIIECAHYISSAIKNGTSCVVHCSDGWDRTSQTVALAQLLLDPFYRTIHGFEILIEKDWLAFGHKFDDRCSHTAAQSEEAAKEVSPIFSQWLDTVWQVHRQFPRAFQFNARFLVHMHEFVYACQHGTFLGNCEKDRKDLAVARRTKSLWTHFDSRAEDYRNPFYEPTLYTDLLGVSTRAANIEVFAPLYSRWEDGILPRESLEDTMATSLDHIAVLQSTIAAMEARVAELREITGRGSVGSNSCMSSMSAAGKSNIFSKRSRLTPLTSSLKAGLSRQETAESGVYDGSLTSSEDSLLAGTVVRWQSLRDADECSAKGCTVEFATRAEKRLHCHRCGKIFCRRCLRSSEKERLCRQCGDHSPQ
ncbi:hypothetical protein PMAYCL1PPCAC_10360, partial [Pristionchus mayeri]